MSLSKRQISFLATTAVSIVIIVITVIAFSKDRYCTDLQVQFTSETEGSFIRKSDIQDLINAYYPKLYETEINDINTLVLEKAIDSVPQVKKVDVYTTLGGSLNIDIQERIPLLRIYDKAGNTAYVDTEGFIMPVSAKRIMRVLIANGNIKTLPKDLRKLSVFNDSLPEYEHLFDLAKQIKNDKFLRYQIGQIHINKKGDYELVPLVGYHLVNLGKPENFPEKLKNLSHFYLKVLIAEDWNRYSEISLKFKNQIVCSLKE